MRKRSFKLSAMALELFLMLSVAAAAGAQSGVSLTVVPDADATGDPSTYHFTPEEGANGSGITHVFTLKNETKTPVTISRIDASCSCTTAVIQSDGAQAESGENVTVAPGAEAKIKVTVSFGDTAAGAIDKAVMVHVGDQADPAATLRVVGTIVPLVVFAPSPLDFGTVTAGKGKALVFAVGISPRAPNPGNEPVMVSSVPYVKVAPFFGSMPNPMFPKNYRVLAYQATVPADAPMGDFSGTISFAAQSSTPAAPTGTALVFGEGPVRTQPVTAVFMPTSGVIVQGNVSGDLSVTPRTVVFGTVTSGQGSSMRETISSKSGRNLSQMTFTSDAPWLSGRMMGRSGAGGAWSVQIDISGSAPAGGLTANLVGALGREKIVIPVQAYVVARG